MWLFFLLVMPQLRSDVDVHFSSERNFMLSCDIVLHHVVAGVDALSFAFGLLWCVDTIRSDHRIHISIDSSSCKMLSVSEPSSSSFWLSVSFSISSGGFTVPSSDDSDPDVAIDTTSIACHMSSTSVEDSSAPFILGWKEKFNSWVGDLRWDDPPVLHTPLLLLLSKELDSQRRSVWMSPSARYRSGMFDPHPDSYYSYDIISCCDL